MKFASTALAALAVALAAAGLRAGPHAGHQPAAPTAGRRVSDDRRRRRAVRRRGREGPVRLSRSSASQVNWVNPTYITDDTDALAARSNAECTEKAVDYALEAAKYAALPGLDPT